MAETPTKPPQEEEGEDSNEATTPSPTKKGKEFKFPEGVNVPSSVDTSLVTGDMVDMLNQLSTERINGALETYDTQFKLRGSEIRSPRNYLRGILKGLTGGNPGKYGLPNGVIIPASITKEMLEEGDLLDILKTMSVRDINQCFRDFDEQLKRKNKKSEEIRNKHGYLLGIIKSGSPFNLPQGVVVPSSISLTMLKGEVLETIQGLPAVNINVAFAEYDDMMQRKADSIRSKFGYLLGIVKRVKKNFDEEAAEHVASQQQKGTSPAKNGKGGQSPTKTANGGATAEANGTTATGSDAKGETSEIMTSFVKVTNELMVERQARNTLENKVKQSETQREETNQKILRLMQELAVEKETRERSALEVQRLKKDLAFERSLREAAEEKVQVLEEGRAQLQQSPGKGSDQVQKLQLDLSIERGLREKTEKLLRTAEGRIEELNQEVVFLQNKKSLFSNWMNPDNGKASELPPSLAGLSELVSMADFDPETMTFKVKETGSSS